VESGKLSAPDWLNWPVDPQTLAPEGHYAIEGVGFLPRVSLILDTISKPGLVRWAERQGEDRVLAAVKRAATALRTHPDAPGRLVGQTFKELGALRQEARATNAAALGTAAHAWIEWWSRRALGEDRPEPVIVEAIRPAVDAWKRWAADVAFTPLLVEHRAWCTEPSCGFAGTLDSVAEVEGQTTLCDWKRASSIDREGYDLQIGGAYSHLLTRSTGLIADRALIVKLPQTAGDVETRELTPLQMTELLEIFRALLTFWRWQRERTETASNDRMAARRAQAQPSSVVTSAIPPSTPYMEIAL
jgi:hypothetical protein